MKRMVGEGVRLLAMGLVLAAGVAAGAESRGRAEARSTVIPEASLHYALSQLADDPREVLRHVLSAAELDPSSSFLQMEVAQAYFRIREPEKAVDRATEALRLDPGNAEARWFLMSWYRHRAERDMDALRSTDLALEQAMALRALRPEDDRVAEELAALYTLRANLVPGDERERNENLRRAAETLEATATGGNRDPEMLLRIAELRFRMEDWEVGAQAIREALQARPGWPEALRKLGDAEAARGRFKEAEDAYRQVLEVQSSDSETRVLLSQILFFQDREEEAEKEIRTALEGDLGPGMQRRALFLLARLLADLGEYREAEFRYRMIIEAFPGFDDAREDFARFLADRGRRGDALAEYDRLMARQPKGGFDWCDTASRKGALLLEMGRVKDARALLEDALRAAPDNPWVMLQLLDVYRTEGERREAVRLLARKRAQIGEPGALALLEAQVWMERGEENRALSILGRFVRDSRESEESWGAAGEALAEVRAYDDALRMLDDGIRRYPESPGLARVRAQVLFEKGDVGEAEDLARARLAKDPDDLDTVGFLANRILADTRRYGEAVRLLEQTAKRRKEPTRVLDLWLVEAYRLAKDTAKGGPFGAESAARWPRDVRFSVYQHVFPLLDGDETGPVSAFQAILEKDWADLRAHLLVVECLQRSHHYVATLPFLERTHRLFPGDERVWFAEGVSWERMKDTAKAEESFRKALSINPLHHSAMNWLGYMLAEEGRDLDEAVRLLTRALELDPGNAAYLDSLGWAFLRKGEPARARTYLQAAARRMGYDPVVRQHLAALYDQAGDRERALREYRAAVSQGLEEADGLAEVEARIQALEGGEP